MKNIIRLVYFATDVKDWFSYGKLNVFLSYYLMFGLLSINNGWTTIMTTFDIDNI